jgi:hypothetical protein
MLRVLRVAVVGLVAWPLAGVTPPADAQEIGVFAVRSTSTNTELPTPAGVGVAVARDVGHGLMLRLSYARMHDATEKPGTVCTVSSPRIGCHTEEVSTTDTFSGLRFGVLEAVHVQGVVRVGLGLGISLNAVGVDARGESGRRADLEVPRTGQVGYLGMLTLDVHPLRAIPLQITGSVFRHWVHWEACSYPPVDSPFCSYDTFREAELGLAYRVP